MTAWSALARVTVEVELTPGVWYDLSARALQNGARGGPMAADTGRQTELPRIEPSRLTSVVLDNSDGALTAGNALAPSPFFPNWRNGKRIRIRETVGSRTFDEFLGFLQIPETVVQTEALDQTVTVTAIDRLGALDTARTFVSTLAEYIAYTGGSLLVGFWPLVEAAGDTFRDYADVQPPMIARRSDSPNPELAPAEPTYGPSGGSTIPGDDAAGLRLTPGTGALGNTTATVFRAWELGADFTQAFNPSPPPVIRLHAGDLMTVVAWVDFDKTVDGVQGVWSLTLYDDATHANITVATLTRNTFLSTDPSPGEWRADIFTLSGGISGTVTTGLSTYIGGGPVPVAMQFSYTPNTLRLWFGDQEIATTPTGSIPDAQRLLGSSGVGPIAGTISYAQLYVGNYTRAMYLDQLRQGLSGTGGLALQTTGQRIRTVAAYAGIPAGELALDQGVTVMPKARLANRKPRDVMGEAAETERGRLFVDGRGLLTFQDRIRVYNV